MASTTIGTEGGRRSDPRGEGRAKAPAAVAQAEPGSFVGRQVQIAIAVALIGFSAWLALAFSTWTVTDPSLSQSNGNPVENFAGAAGAVVADLALQIFGLGAVLVVALPAIWGVLLATGREVDRVGRRAWFALAGIVLASGAIGCIGAPAGWPLPIGLGGVAGDLVLKFPALATGSFPDGITALVLGATIALPAGWLFLSGAALVDRGSVPMLSKDRAGAARLSGSTRPSIVEDEEDEEPGEGRFALLFGAVQHGLYSARAAVDRRRSARATARHEPAEFGDRFDTWSDEAEVEDAPPAPRETQRQIRVTAPYQPQGFVDPLAEDEDEIDVGRPRRDRPDTFRFDATARRAAPVVDEEDEDGFDDGRAHGHDAVVEADDRDEPSDDERADSVEPPYAEDDRIEPAEPLDPARAPIEEAAGGWRGLAANIVAFPGKKRAKAEAADAVRPGPRAEPRAAPRNPEARSAPARPAAGEAARGAEARVVPAAASPAPARSAARGQAAATAPLRHLAPLPFELPPVELLSLPKARSKDQTLSPEILQENARLLEGVLDDFGVKGEIIEVRPGPVVTLYELEPAPGIKSSRVIGLADDIARSMSAIAARVAVIPGKNAIGIELPNQRRETVYFREMIASDTFQQNKSKLALALGKTIGGEPVIADLAKMPHLLVAGTTGSGKSVSINTMILSLLFRMTPAECRMIMIDPKMLELSIYDGIPHLLSPVVTDPKKAVVALKWTVREMEDRYRKMSKVGVRNIDGFNARVASAIEKGESISRTVQTGFDRETGEPIFECEEFDLAPLPYIVVIIDEMADLMMVAGKEIEGTVQRLAQMARAAGIHVVMATQRPSVDVITGTIKANFPTRISFQVTSKIDSRTILQEQGAEQLLGMGDMLFMAGGGRIQRVHGPFVDDAEVEEIVKHLKAQGTPDYLDAILEEEDEEGAAPASGGKGGGGGDDVSGLEESADLYDQAVAVVLRDGKASTSYVQRRLQIGYNRAASIIERMEKEGIVGPANHAGKREILVPMEEERA
ncbi:cell division protein [Aureimonas sp. Leaf454]|uniref:FtsK/SpoIIIE family DNA translocase n=1 Tax=Aureimonas sp. Leaf454 TaxID=1736381 RepID=UPI0007013D44|nr:DNA translocase FtsK [Aureimonas sp. Leaf454]KQT52037.1 cell division protein [Aureimonas sp. Leaf454]